MSDHSDCNKDNINVEEPRTCAYITALENFRVYKIDCLYCDRYFQIKKWRHFVEHVKSEHKLSDDNNEVDIKLEESSASTHSSRGTLSATQANETVAMAINVDQTADTEIETKNVNGDAASCHEDEGENLSDSDTDAEIASIDSFTTKKKRKKRNQSPLEETKKEIEINVETTDKSLILSLIDLMRSHFRLWYATKIKEACTEKTFNEFFSRFEKENQLRLKRVKVFRGILNVRDWYQKMTENNQYETLTYPQSEYYSKLAAYLPDRLDGKSCDICKRILPDHVQHYAHKRQEHPDSSTTQQDGDNAQINGIPKAKIDEYLRARYPLTEPLNLECQVCFTTTTIRWKFIHHIKTHIDLREFICDICALAFVGPIGLAVHRKRHFGKNKLHCLICGAEFNGFSTLKTHRVNFHRPIEGTIEEIEAMLKEVKRKKGGGRPAGSKWGLVKIGFDSIRHRKCFLCPFCDNKYLYHAGLHKHLNLHHKNEWLRQKHIWRNRNRKNIN